MISVQGLGKGGSGASIPSLGDWQNEEVGGL